MKIILLMALLVSSARAISYDSGNSTGSDGGPITPTAVTVSSLGSNRIVTTGAGGVLVTYSTFTLTGAGNAGLGTASPATLLDVNGNAQFGTGVTKSTFSATGALTIAAAASLIAPTIAGATTFTSSVTVKAATSITGDADFTGPNGIAMNRKRLNLDVAAGTWGLGYKANSGKEDIQFDAYDDFVFVPANAAGGNFGIGTDLTPDAQLEILSSKSPTQYVISASSQSDVLGSVWGVTGAGHVVSSGTTPGIACNAGTPVMAADSNDMSGQYTAGVSAANCTITFANAFTKKPRCWCNDETNILVIQALSTTTTLKCTAAITLGSDVITYGCQAAP